MPRQYLPLADGGVYFEGYGAAKRPCGRVEIASAATSAEEIWNGVGNPVYPPAKRELQKHGLSCAGKRAVQLQKDDYEKYDLFIGMDRANIRNMTCISAATRRIRSESSWILPITAGT